MLFYQTFISISGVSRRVFGVLDGWLGSRHQTGPAVPVPEYRHGFPYSLYYGTRVPWLRWYYGPMIPRYHSATTRQHHADMVPWYHGTMLLWHHLAVEPWYHSTMLSWYQGPGHRAIVPRHDGTMVPWCKGTMVTWNHGNHGTIVPWCRGDMSRSQHGAMERWPEPG